MPAISAEITYSHRISRFLDLNINISMIGGLDYPKAFRILGPLKKGVKEARADV